MSNLTMPSSPPSILIRNNQTMTRVDLKKHRGQEKNNIITMQFVNTPLLLTFRPRHTLNVSLSSVHHQNPVQFRMVSMRSDKPLCASPRLSLSQKFPPTLPLKRFQYSSFQGISSSASSLFQRLSPPGDQWCDVLGFKVQSP